MHVDKTAAQVIEEFQGGKLLKGEAIRLLSTMKEAALSLPEELKEGVDELKKGLEEGTKMSIL